VHWNDALRNTLGEQGSQYAVAARHERPRMRRRGRPVDYYPAIRTRIAIVNRPPNSGVAHRFGTDMNNQSYERNNYNAPIYSHERHMR
jgi:hypothetical protein